MSIVGIDMRCTKCKKHFMMHDPRYVDTLPSGHAGVCLHQGQWESYFHHKIAKVGDDSGPGGAVCRGGSQGALPLAQVQIYRSMGQGMYLLKYKSYFLHQ